MAGYACLRGAKSFFGKVLDECGKVGQGAFRSTKHHTMKLLLATIILGWAAIVTFAGSDLARFIDRILPDEPTKAVVRRHR